MSGDFFVLLWLLHFLQSTFMCFVLFEPHIINVDNYSRIIEAETASNKLGGHIHLCG